jgi:hypothetical protein
MLSKVTEITGVRIINRPTPYTPFRLIRLSLPILQAPKVTKLLKKTAKCDKSMFLVYKYRENCPILASC